ncbi:MAG: TcpQ domain-containing protein [Desulfovibrio sp.]|uniref:TcpQ domain-containing protein n=1 Tax=Desulfovibrio sp. TaxID=885 RepID=UPI0025BFE0D3|nr:TcpQ domain-containing protein [Desulfovibrio sp.]MBS6829937.1 TcpQ domain-containing protein [Desulfovibrio sp.]
MKKSTSAILIFCQLCASGCVMHKSGPGSFDGLSETYAADAQAFATQTAEELSRRHAPAHTSVALDRAPGVFGDVLEQKLRADGFALGSSGLGVSYRLDTLETDGTPMRGYVQVACSDGQMFSFTREVFKGTEPPLAYPLPEEHPLESRPLPERAPMATVPDQASAAAMPAATPSVKVYPVRRTAAAAVVARRSGVPVKDFCRWNQVAPTTTLAKGSPVYLSEPPADVLEGQPAPQAVTPAPMPDPVSLPSRAQTSPTLTLGKPKPSEPVAYAPVAVNMPTAPSPETSAPVTEPPVAPAPSTPTVSSEAPTPVAATAIEAVPVWEIHKGEMLRGLMEGWAAIAGYSLIWNAQNDYEMRSSATFSGVFVDAVKNFFAALQANGLALRVTIYQGNKVMEVSEH